MTGLFHQLGQKWFLIKFTLWSRRFLPKNCRPLAQKTKAWWFFLKKHFFTDFRRILVLWKSLLYFKKTFFPVTFEPVDGIWPFEISGYHEPNSHNFCLLTFILSKNSLKSSKIKRCDIPHFLTKHGIYGSLHGTLVLHWDCTIYYTQLQCIAMCAQ